MTNASAAQLQERPLAGGAPGASHDAEVEAGDEWRFVEGDEIAPGRHAVRLLGGGSRYEAYLAWDDDLHSLVVVKILRPGRVEDRSALTGLAAEAGSLEALQHPVLLRCFGATLDGPRPHIVLEFLDGPRLSTLLRRYGPLAFEQLVPLGLQVCSVLHYMSTQGMLHLDVKPQNIIMGAPPRLIDLSIAMPFDEGGSLDHLVGTDAYMAPEQCDPLGCGGVGPKADVWGLGVSLFEATTGARPFPDADEEQRSQGGWPQIDLEAPPLPVAVPSVLSTAIHACLERRPEDRPTPAELASALETLLELIPRRPVLGRFKPKLR